MVLSISCLLSSGVRPNYVTVSFLWRLCKVLSGGHGLVNECLGFSWGPWRRPSASGSRFQSCKRSPGDLSEPSRGTLSHVSSGLASYWTLGMDDHPLIVSTPSRNSSYFMYLSRMSADGCFAPSEWTPNCHAGFPGLVTWKRFSIDRKSTLYPKSLGCKQQYRF